jgi:hypothetical protein
MTAEIYRSAQGKMVDFAAMRLQNEDTPAVGNMNVTAGGKPLQSKAAQTKVSKTNSLMAPPLVNIAQDGPVVSSSSAAAAKLAEQKASVEQLEKEMAVAIANNPPVVLEQAIASIQEEGATLTGLAAAVAKASSKKGSA